MLQTTKIEDYDVRMYVLRRVFTKIFHIEKSVEELLQVIWDMQMDNDFYFARKIGEKYTVNFMRERVYL